MRNMCLILSLLLAAPMAYAQGGAPEDAKAAGQSGAVKPLVQCATVQKIDGKDTITDIRKADASGKCKADEATITTTISAASGGKASK